MTTTTTSLSPQLALRSVGERHVPDVRRVERPAEQAGHSITRVSSPTSTSLPLRAPAARSAASSSSGGGGEPSTRKPTIGAEDLERRGPRLRPVDQELGKPLRIGLRRQDRRAKLEQLALQLLDPCSRRGRDAEDADDPIVVELERRVLG